MNTTPWDTAEMLNTPEAIAAYLEQSILEDSPEEFQRSRENVARAVAKITKTEPDTKSLGGTLDALGLSLTVQCNA